MVVLNRDDANAYKIQHNLLCEFIVTIMNTVSDKQVTVIFVTRCILEIVS